MLASLPTIPLSFTLDTKTKLKAKLDYSKQSNQSIKEERDPAQIVCDYFSQVLGPQTTYLNLANEAVPFQQACCPDPKQCKFALAPGKNPSKPVLSSSNSEIAKMLDLNPANVTKKLKCFPFYLCHESPIHLGDMNLLQLLKQEWKMFFSSNQEHSGYGGLPYLDMFDVITTSGSLQVSRVTQGGTLKLVYSEMIIIPSNPNASDLVSEVTSLPFNLVIKAVECMAGLKTCSHSHSIVVSDVSLQAPIDLNNGLAAFSLSTQYGSSLQAKPQFYEFEKGYLMATLSKALPSLSSSVRKRIHQQVFLSSPINQRKLNCFVTMAREAGKAGFHRTLSTNLTFSPGCSSIVTPNTDVVLLETLPASGHFSYLLCVCVCFFLK